MGYPMTYTRVVGRNQLHGDYQTERLSEREYNAPRNLVAGDLRRLEQDQRDLLHVAGYARRAGITAEQARRVLDDFFNGIPWADGLDFAEARDQWQKHAGEVGGGLDPSLIHGAGIMGLVARDQA